MGASPASAVARARDVAGLLDALQASDPGRPRLTWYGPGAERVELSARVLANWVVKTANLLVDELGVEPGDVVALDLPGHWRSVVWQLALEVVGADPSTDGSGLTVRTDPDAAEPGDVLVTLPALDRSAPRLPEGVVDYNAEVGGQPDVLVVPPAGMSLATSDGRQDGVPAPRVLVVVGPGRVAPLSEVVLPTLRRDGSVVIVHPDVDAEALIASEQVTRRWEASTGLS